MRGQGHVVGIEAACLIEAVVLQANAETARQGLLDADSEEGAVRTAAMRVVQRHGGQEPVAQTLPVIAGAPVEQGGWGKEIPGPYAGAEIEVGPDLLGVCLLYTSPSPRD